MSTFISKCDVNDEHLPNTVYKELIIHTNTCEIDAHAHGKHGKHINKDSNE